MLDSDQTCEGNPRRFQTTHWSVVLAAGRDGDALSRDAMAALYRVYWPPLYAFIRRRGYSRDDALDLIQEFFVYMLDKRLVQNADPEKGRFRSYLLGALKHFLSANRRRANALKRGGGRAPLIVGGAM